MGVGVLGESTWVCVCATACMGVCVKVRVCKCVCQSERVCECVSTLKAFSTVIPKSGNSSILIKRDQAVKKNIPPTAFLSVSCLHLLSVKIKKNFGSWSILVSESKCQFQFDQPQPLF